MRSRVLDGTVAGVAMLIALVVFAATARAKTVELREYTLSASKQEQLRERWIDQLQARYGTDTWAPMRYELGNRDLRLMGLPPKRVLLSHRYRVPTAVYPDGRMVRLTRSGSGKGGGNGGGGHGGGGHGGGGSSGAAADPGLVTYAGAGFAGIRPGAWLLLINDGSIGWCSMAHVYGSPGSYAVSTAGHCGKAGDVGTVIGAVGNHTESGVPVPVLLDFGTFSRSTGDAGLGRDWALISVESQYQSLVTPTMAFWGGPIGMYTSQGEAVAPNLSGNNPSVDVNPDPTLAQGVVHYGHGTGIGAGGTPRAGAAIAWLPDHFMFSGAITPGDSGSGANTLTGDAVGDNREAVGIMGGTRATQVGATLANGQILPYPAPVAGAP